MAVLVEVRHEDRRKDPRRSTMSRFVRDFVRGGRDGYIVSVIPEPMAAEALGLPAVTCSSYRNSMLETNVWLSAGDTVSAVHNDADNIVNCLLQGEKRWAVVNPRHKPLLSMQSRMHAEENDPTAFLQRSDVSDVNASAVDLLRYPTVRDVPWEWAVVRAGDCLYLPPGYLHQVTSPPGRNLAVSFMFASLFNASEWQPNRTCIDATRRYEREAVAAGGRLVNLTETRGGGPGHSPAAGAFHAVEEPSGWPAAQGLRDSSGWASLASLPVAWKFSGHGSVPMGYQSPVEVAESLAIVVDTVGGRVGAEAFASTFVATGGGDNRAAVRVWAELMRHFGAAFSEGCDLTTAVEDVPEGPACSFGVPGCSEAQGMERGGVPWWCHCEVDAASTTNLSVATLKRMAMSMDAAHASVAEKAEARSGAQSDDDGRMALRERILSGYASSDQELRDVDDEGEFEEEGDDDDQEGNQDGSGDEEEGEDVEEEGAVRDGDEDDDDDSEQGAVDKIGFGSRLWRRFGRLGCKEMERSDEPRADRYDFAASPEDDKSRAVDVAPAPQMRALAPDVDQGWVELGAEGPRHF